MQRPNFSDKFSENLALLPLMDTVAAIELVDQSGVPVAKIENKPGQAGSLRVYCWLAETLGAITPEAAECALTIYAEHTQDARAHPGKHPNIDRLFNIKTPDQTLQVKHL
ncbi:DUF2322 family protein [Duganella sp. sic0402]|uniref:DUF2322 family protein n=1 Tax=Duganella sp. sic0402 TaxID=2854786 RepID=UPI001C449146|nr:DUF2322 family protein [Duganella sp. sic0402]MBV7535543.1 DUF2322 family protein [Duganella sp. sic0402]